MRALLLAVEIVRVALGAIWSNKLRSFLTILGNVVAVASIMTLVSLIQGISDEVADVIVTEMSADSFMIDRMGLVASEDDMERRRGNPRITLDDQAAVRGFGGRIAAVMAQGQENGEIRYRNEVLEQVTIQGVTDEFHRFPTFTAERGRLLTPIRSVPQPERSAARMVRGRPVVRPGRSAGADHHDPGRSLSRRRGEPAERHVVRTIPG